MSLPIPLTVRLSTTSTDMHIGAQVRDLTFGWTDPGGYASCRVSLDRPLSLQPAEIAYYGTLTVHDARNGTTVWEGRLEDPGRSAGRDGQVWDLAALGGKAHTQDRTLPLLYVDGGYSPWQRVDNATPGGQDGTSVDPGDAAGLRQALVLRFPQALAVSSGSRVVVRHSGAQAAGQKIARVSYTWDAGITSPNLTVQLVTRTDGNVGTGEVASTQTWTTAGGSASPTVVTNFPNNPSPTWRNTAEFWIQYAGGAGTVTADTWWASLYNVSLRTMLLTATGTEITTGYAAPTVLASEVVADLLGRVLTGFDGSTAIIATTSYGIDQLAYPDGVTPEKVLQDLLALEAGYTWRAWERTASGKFRFEWTPVPNTVRYEADVVDGYDSQGSADGLYNQVTVRGRDLSGRVLTLTRTATVPALDAAGLVRQGQVDLGDEVWSTAAAQRVGDAWLAARQYPPNAGRLRISGPVLDLTTHRYVMPWEIRPGLIRVRGILPRPDALNATSRDGVTVFRIVAAEYRASDAAATLDLDSPAPSVPQALADLARAVSNPRR
ncbi:hypothetical protein [Micromonospora zhanjiangensis]|uniref:Minor tail protein n=1 Tax=Micromonospora zhanjiangensis TaxID=1522057 RepID=A0ABV8KNR1_9ACTN